MKKRTILMWAIILPLSVGLFVSGCKKKTECPTVDYTTLDAAIVQAQASHDAAVEGTEIGQYMVGAKAELQTAITLAQGVRNTDCVKQTELGAAKTNLDAAVAIFNGKQVTDVSPTNLVAHWMFNGNANDATGNGNNGTPTAGHTFFGGGLAPALVADRFENPDYCYHFDKGCNIEVPYSTALNPESMTISLWVNMEEQPNNDYMIALDRWNGWKLNLQDADLLFFTVQVLLDGNPTYINHDSQGANTVPAGTWTHIAVSYTDGLMNFYINGALVFSWTGADAQGTPVTVDNINLSIGSDLPTGTYSPDSNSPNFVEWGGYWKGAIDDIRFYNISLTETQVNSIYLFEKDHVVE